jgi:hypothetical protein
MRPHSNPSLATTWQCRINRVPELSLLPNGLPNLNARLACILRCRQDSGSIDSSSVSTARRISTTVLSTVIHGILVHDFEREVACIRLTAASQVTNGLIGVTALLNIHLGGACTEPWRGPGGRQQCRGAWQRQPLRRRQCATPDSFAAATLPRCCGDACTASSHRISSINQTQDQYPCPWLRPGRWGAAPHWVRRLSTTSRRF